MPTKKKSKRKKISKVVKQPTDPLVAELQQILPIASLSLPHLAKAIKGGALVFLTSDPLILQQAPLIEGKYKIYVTDNYAEAQDIMVHGRRRSSFEGEHNDSRKSDG